MAKTFRGGTLLKIPFKLGRKEKKLRVKMQICRLLVIGVGPDIGNDGCGAYNFREIFHQGGFGVLPLFCPILHP